MFELPEAKRVRREDLGNPDDSGVNADDALGDDEAMQARVNAQIAAALGLDNDDDDEPRAGGADPHAHNVNDANFDRDGEPDTKHGYEFNLFSTAGAGGPAGPAKVILDDENEDLGDGAFVRPRPLSHYTAKTPSAKEKEQYSLAAVTADDIVRRSAQPSWGMAMPWKVVSIKATRKAKPGDKRVEVLMESTDETAVKRKRPGKKQRILLRQRTRTKAQAAEEAAKKELEKEEHIKDKKKRLNRIKKLRKRAKDKEKKMAGDEEANAGDGGSDSDGDE